MFDGGNERGAPFASTGAAVLQRFHDVMRRVHAGEDDLDEVLAEIARSVVEFAGFAQGVISLVQPSGVLEAVVVEGPDRLGRPSAGTTTSVEGFEKDFAEADRSGLLMFLPGDPARRWATLGPLGETHPEESSSADAHSSWGDQDRLVALLEGPTGEFLGVLDVDRPGDLHRPTAGELQLLEMFAVQAGLAIHVVRARARMTDQLRLGEAHREVVRAASALDLEELAAQIALTSRAAFGADSAQVELMTSEDVPRAGATVPDGERGLQGVVAELTAHELDGSEHTWLSADGTVLGITLGLTQGLPVMGAMALCRDVPWSRLEQQAISLLGQDLGRAVHNARLHHRERAVGRRLRALDESTRRMIANVTHEMKNPLTSLNGHLELLTTDVEPAHLVPMQRSAGRLLGLVDSFMDVMQEGPEAQPSSLDVVNLSRLVRAEVDSAELLAQCAGVTLRAQLPVAPVVVRGEVRGLERLVTNLLSNALKFTPDGGVVTVQCQRKDDQGVLRVTDTGIGISASDQRRLFERYFRSTNPAALAIEGTGLGLAIVGEVVARHGGTIECRSVLGEGTTFEVRLPVAKQ